MRTSFYSDISPVSIVPHLYILSNEQARNLLERGGGGGGGWGGGILKRSVVQIPGGFPGLFLC